MEFGYEVGIDPVFMIMNCIFYWKIIGISFFRKKRNFILKEGIGLILEKFSMWGLLEREIRVQKLSYESSFKEKESKIRPSLKGCLTGGFTLAAIGLFSWWKFIKN